MFALIFSTNSVKAEEKKDTNSKKSKISTAINGFSFRSIGPAFMSGRISDIAIDPNNENIWYVAVSSGGAWKTENAGTTWTPLTDNQPFFSTGCITIDPNNSSSIWLGTGENVGGRHIGIGHGIYHSLDGGKSWNDMGLKKSEHISKIIIHPNDSNIIWVASQGPLWSSGGERGLFKSTDGGKTWNNKLEINKWTGVTDLVIDPTNPDILYAASWQRHRNVAALMDGGPGTAMYKSTDGGDNWIEINNGLPRSNMGKIGLAISPIDPTVLYIAVELDRRNGAVYKSTDSGGSWKKMSDTVSGGTGPHYYQELIASPHVFDKIYLMNVRVLVSDDGGKNFSQMRESQKHSDNHSLTFKENDPNYMLIGTDGGIYESFDDSKNWKYVSNLPLTQFYKLAVDDAEPFYNIYGGTQDNNTQGGPSRTFKRNGISNDDWYVVLGGDGHQPATEPGNPNIVYAQSQQGYLNRVDRTTGEAVSIRPYSGLNEDYERFNWDSPILVSSHNPKRLYFGSQRVWTSDDRGDSWTPISKDLTKNQERLELPIMGKQQSWDTALDVYAMSTYNTITSLSESVLNQNILYAGTDDGLIQTTKDGGLTWISMSVDKLPGVPSTSFVNDIKADHFDSQVAYVALDNHKFGDYRPYLYKTSNGGKSWKPIVNGLPDDTFLWRIVQDHINPNLLFLASEYGLYFSNNQGEKWIKFSTGLPTISIRDLAIQKRENDLVLATFGRGFYVLDDYSPLRSINKENSNEHLLFDVREALQYNPIRSGTSSQGSSYYSSENPPYGAVFTYNLPKSYKSLKSIRSEKEKELDKLNKDVPFSGWSELDKEVNESKPKLILEIRDIKGELVDRINGSTKKGINRVTWNLSKPLPVTLNSNSRNYQSSIPVKPGKYSLRLLELVNGELSELTKSKTFNVKRIRENVLKNPLTTEIDDFITELNKFEISSSMIISNYRKAKKKQTNFDYALRYINNIDSGLTNRVKSLKDEMNLIEVLLFGNKSKKEIGEKDTPLVADRISVAKRSLYGNSYGPTKHHIESFKIGKKQWNSIVPKINNFIDAVDKLSQNLESLGAPKIID